MPDCLKTLLDLFGYPANAVSPLSNGSLRLRYCTYPFARKFPPCHVGPPSGSVHPPEMHGDMGHHSLPEEVNDEPRVMRRRIRGKTPLHVVVGRGASPPPKRRKWLSLPGPVGGGPSVWTLVSLVRARAVLCVRETCRITASNWPT